jgi:predicted DNA-binding transcriptional regulator AlpA
MPPHFPRIENFWVLVEWSGLTIALLQTSSNGDNLMVRKVMRLPAVLAATGWSRSSLYLKISERKFPAGVKLDPDGQAVVWWEDEVEAFQKAAVDAAREAA